MRTAPIWLAAAFLLLALPAHATNKCVDANGRVTYQQDPCPGKVVRVQPKPPEAAPVPAAEIPMQRPARPALAEGSTACARVREQIAALREKLGAASMHEQAAIEQMIARAKSEYSYCDL